MEALTSPLHECEDAVWLRHSESLPAAARNAARQIAHRIGLLPERVAEVEVAVSEAATNLRRHAADGAMVLRVVRTDTEAALEFLTMDGGPGMANVPGALADGYSSHGTLGIGLGAIARLADTFDLHSLPGRGTVLAARCWNRTPGGRAAAAQGEPVAAGLTRPMSGQDLCGDAWAIRPAAPAPARAPRPAAVPTRLDWAALTNRAAPRPAAPGPTGSGAFLLMFCDGLGHGPLASRATSDAVAAFHHSPAQAPEQVLADLHRALRAGRGGAIAVALIEPAERRLTFSGVGNIGAFVVDTATGGRRALPSTPGIVGHQMTTPHTVRQELPPHSAVVLHSDGLTDRWRAADVPGLFGHLPVTAAALLLRDAGVRRDDAGVVVAKGAW
ncbi:ATP-binding SpoIIE family protein phosphatase [Kitasatospora sp. NPDC004531]